MKTFTKSLALLLALLVAFGVSVSAAELPEELDALPVITIGEATTGNLTGEALWYRCRTQTNAYRLTVTGSGIICNLYQEDGEFAGSYTGDPSESSIFGLYGVTYIEVLGTGDFTILIEPATMWEVLNGLKTTLEGLTAEDWSAAWELISGELGILFTGFFSDFSIVEFLADIGMLPVFGIMLGFFFAPFSVGGTLIISLISALFLPITLLLSPFMLIQSIMDLFK